MSKGIVRFIALVVIITVVTCTMTTALGESTKNSVKKFYDMAEYYGYTIRDCYAYSGEECVSEVKLSNSETNFSVYIKTDRKSHAVSFYCKGKVRKLSGIEKILKANAVELDRQLLLAGKVQSIGDRLERYARQRGWNVNRFCHIGKKAYDEFSFSNEQKSFKVRITGEMKDKRVVISYRRNSKSSSAKNIKKWLDKYASGHDVFIY